MVNVTIEKTIIVDGCAVHYTVTGEGEKPLLLVHGSGAHHRWWHAVTPHLAPRWRVIELDLSGHGDSGYRPCYTPELWAREVTATIESAVGEPTVVVGHSMGGRVGITAAARYPATVLGLILLETVVRPPHEHRSRAQSESEHLISTYPDAETARRQFHLLPPQPHPDPAILEPVIDYSLIRTAEGWSWKFDPKVLWRFDDAYVGARLSEVACPIAFLYGEASSLVSARMADYVRSVHPGLRVEPIAEAHHHLPLDAPRQCARLIDEIAANWSATHPS